MISPNQSFEEVNRRCTTFTDVFVTMAQNPNRIKRISIQLVNMTDPQAAIKRLLPILVPMTHG